MKKAISLLCLLALCLSAMLTLSSCATVKTSGGYGDKDEKATENKEKEDNTITVAVAEYEPGDAPIKEFYVYLVRTGNYRLDVDVTSEHGSVLSAFAEFSNGISCIDLTPYLVKNSSELVEKDYPIYMYLYNEYVYMKNNVDDYSDITSKWYKQNLNENRTAFYEINFPDYYNFEKLFDDSKYEKVPGKSNTYKQKSGTEIWLIGDYYAHDVICTIEDGKCTFSMQLAEEDMGIALTQTITYSSVGEVNITLPDAEEYGT